MAKNIRDIRVNKSLDEICSVYCMSCRRKTRNKVISSIDIYYRDDYVDVVLQANDNYQIIECQGCGSVSFRNEYSNSQDIDSEGNSRITEDIYPTCSPDFWETKTLSKMPINLNRIYSETINCFNNKSYILCGVGIRVLVEGLCNENGLNDSSFTEIVQDESFKKKKFTSLKTKIEKLYEDGILTKKNADILHEHRFLGNTAVHELLPPTKEELILALEIIEHIFENLYEIPEKANQLRQKREKKENNRI